MQSKSDETVDEMYASSSSSDSFDGTKEGEGAVAALSADQQQMDTSEWVGREGVRNTASRDPDLVGLQRVDAFVQQLPYFERIKTNAFTSFAQIKENITLALTFNEIRPGLVHWSNRLIVHIHEYGLFFTKSDHIALIKLYLEVALTPNIDLSTVDLCLNLLTELLHKYDKISRTDLVIEWRPIYDLYMRIHKISEISPTLPPEHLEQNGFVRFIVLARIYFPASATAEMLAEWRPMLCPFDMSFFEVTERCKLFLPTLFVEQHEIDGMINAWLKEFLNLWSTMNRKLVWESHLFALFSRVAIDTIGHFDWNPYIPFIFSNLLRGFGLPFGSKDSVTLGIGSSTTSASLNTSMSQQFMYSADDMSSLAKWIVAMIGSGSDATNRGLCMQHIRDLFQALRSFFYPSNTGNWSANLFAFLQNLPGQLIKRIKKQRREKGKWHCNAVSARHIVTDADIGEFVEALKDVTYTAIFSKSHHTAARKAFQFLSFLRSDIILPPFIEKMHASFESVIEPHRYTSMLSCLVVVAREIATYNERLGANQTQLQVIPLMCAVLPGMDPNDSNKFILTLQFLTNTLSCVVLCDCTPALTVRDDLSEYERELCCETAKFEDFVHEFFRRIFAIVDLLAADTSAESSASATAASNQFSIRSKNNFEENFAQAYIIQTFKVLVRQSTKPILKLILNKVKNHINGNTYNARAGRIIANLVAFLVASRKFGRQAFEVFFNLVYENLSKIKESKHYEHFLTEERGDIDVSWNLQLLADILKANGEILVDYMPQIEQLFDWYRLTIHKEAYGHICNAMRNMIVGLTNIIPNEISSVSYELAYDDEQEFFVQHLPVREWAVTADLFNLNIDYHVPSTRELVVATDFVCASLNKSMQFLTHAILTADGFVKTTKEERSRELSFLYHIVYASSRLLKRPQQPLVTGHVQSSVKIGLDDDLDKGLGFENVCMNDRSHEYANLTSPQRESLLTMRQTVIEFCLKLADKLIEMATNETTLFSYILRILATTSVTYGLFVNDFEKMWKNHYTNKASMQNKLLGKRGSLRDELIQRVMLQYQFRSFHIYTSVNALDVRIITLMFRLSVDSHYAIVRKDAQTQLFLVLAHFPFSSLLVVPMLREALIRTGDDSPEGVKLTHDQLKGCLYLLRGNNVAESLMSKQNWQVLVDLWPALFKCQSYEKPSIQALLDKIYHKTNRNFDSFDNRIELSRNVLALCADMNQDVARVYAHDDAKRLAQFRARCAQDEAAITLLMRQLVQVSRESRLAWKNQANSYGSLVYLLDSCVRAEHLLNGDLVKLFVESLVHDNLFIRKIAIDTLCILLKMAKQKKRVIEKPIEHVISDELSGRTVIIPINDSKPGFREDNTWHMYDSQFLSTLETQGPAAEADATKWNKTNFLDKSYAGYYCWPKILRVNTNETRNHPELTHSASFVEAMRSVQDHFTDSAFVSKFFQLLTIEESKGNEKFDSKHFYLFKALFRNYGSVDIVADLFTHLMRLISDRSSQTHECSQKLAAEIVAGLVRGSKYWSIEKLKALWVALKPCLDAIVDNISTESLKLWFSCLHTAVEDQDPRRLTFYINYFVDLIRRVFARKLEQGSAGADAMNVTSFQQSSCLQLLTAYSQLEWRVPQLWSGLYQLFRDNLTHPYKAIREKIATCLTLRDIIDVDFTIFTDHLSTASNLEQVRFDINKFANLNEFVSYLEVNLNKYIELFEIVSEDAIDIARAAQASPSVDAKSYSSPEHLDGINFLQSTFAWLINYRLKALQPINYVILRLLPQLCSVDKIAAQEDTLRMQLPIIRVAFSMWIMDNNCSILFVEQLKKVVKFKSWHSRLAAVQMFQHFGIFNIFLANETLKRAICQIITECLCDEQLEVRLSASLTLTGFIHNKFIDVDNAMLGSLKKLSNIPARVKDAKTGKMLINTNNLVKRHGGILGLCAIVSSCPYDVSPYLPETVTYLCQFINDPVPIAGSVRKCLSEFRRTHHDNWAEHAVAFNEDQLSILSDILISPSYYA